MSLNFPSSPTIGQIHYDETAQYFYEWDGTVWKGISQYSSSHIQSLDDISGSFDGIETTFPITYGSSPLKPESSEAVRLNLGGVIQDPANDYSVSGSNLIFSTAPASGLTFSAISLGSAYNVVEVETRIGSEDDNSTDANFYPVFMDQTPDANLKISTTKLKFNPSTGRLTAPLINSPSDENLKKDVHTIENAVDKINQLRGVDFVWKENDEKSMGVIAQELQKVFPELVAEENDELSVNYNGLIAVLIEAVKELSKGQGEEGG